MIRKFLLDRCALEDLRNPIVCEGVAYWKNLCYGRSYPSRVDVAPSGMRRLLSNTVIVRILDGGADYEYRIAGEAHVVSHGTPLQGRRMSHLDALDADYRPFLKSLYDQVVRTHTPYGVRAAISVSDDHPSLYNSESAFLPLGPSETEVDHILVFTVYNIDSLTASATQW